MQVLYITGSCLSKNTSANMSHNSYIQGFIENGCDVDIIMSSTSWGEEDKKLLLWPTAQYYVYDSESFADRLKAKFKKHELKNVSVSNQTETMQKGAPKKTLKSTFRLLLKECFYKVFPQDPIYPLNKTWLKKASKFSSDKEYDLVVTNSSPAAGHALMLALIKAKHIRFKRWVQIWEDPWYYDLYGKGKQIIYDEEHRLLQGATEILYVSPLTLMYQKRYFPDCAEKMSFIPLPALHYEDKAMKTDDSVSFGYFGDYYSYTRNLKPFYDALVACKAKGYIYGDTDLFLEQTELVEVSGRVTLDKLSKVQAQTDVLVHLCNLRGGQIPGKIYHYSVTDKPVLFILDGTTEEQTMIKDFFAPYNRYVFCENTIESICSAMKSLLETGAPQKIKPVEAFEPKQVVKKLLDDMR